jgi:hypothetical protein
MLVVKRYAFLKGSIDDILIDEEDRWLLDHYSVWIDHNGYAICDKMKNGKRERYRLHRLILNYHQKDKEIDHINRNPLDNRKSNLRLVSHGINMTNCPKRFDSKQIYKGIQKLPSGRFSARVSGGKRVGTFNTAEEAFEKYKEYTNAKYGELCLL